MYLHKVPSQGRTLEAESSIHLKSPEMEHPPCGRSASLCDSSAQRDVLSKDTQRHTGMYGGCFDGILTWLLLLPFTCQSVVARQW